VVTPVRAVVGAALVLIEDEVDTEVETEVEIKVDDETEAEVEVVEEVVDVAVVVGCTEDDVELVGFTTEDDVVGNTLLDVVTGGETLTDGVVTLALVGFTSEAVDPAVPPDSLPSFPWTSLSWRALIMRWTAARLRWDMTCI